MSEFVSKLKPPMKLFIGRLQISPEHSDRLTSTVVTVSVYEAVGAEIEAHGATLVMLGSHGASGFKQATIGSVTSELLDMLPVDCLVIKTSS
ncbi:MAG: universal stress protein [Erythrobacter sp.]|uniref:universal stress protein n=1 Tax=Erythrobacter sp. TaxID=1042 RepID=UPI001B132395|nr:universal stress protein [Erythrobacter sp.]MBO6531340.1 universal stress protein [Erythrobacter sp.]